jgi:tetratricopeptide (TPR) repeat protein
LVLGDEPTLTRISQVREGLRKEIEGRTLANEGKMAEAEALFREAVAVLTSVVKEDDPALSVALADLTRSLLFQHKFVEAESPARECVAIREKRRSPSDWTWSDACNWLGCSLMGQQRYGEAEPLLDCAYQGLKQWKAIVGTERVKQALYDLAWVYEATGQADKRTALDMQSAVESEAENRLRAEILCSEMEAGAAGAVNRLGWLLATCASPVVRDGPTAVAIAERAAISTNYKDHAILGTLAAAFAEAGEFEKAVNTQKLAISLVSNESSKLAYAARLKLYESGKPYHEDE